MIVLHFVLSAFYKINRFFFRNLDFLIMWKIKKFITSKKV